VRLDVDSGSGYQSRQDWSGRTEVSLLVVPDFAMCFANYAHCLWESRSVTGGSRRPAVVDLVADSGLTLVLGRSGRNDEVCCGSNGAMWATTLCEFYASRLGERWCSQFD
jgi:hypothetical protein